MVRSRLLVHAAHHSQAPLNWRNVLVGGSQAEACGFAQRQLLARILCINKFLDEAARHRA
jgi:hypothetical protein